MFSVSTVRHRVSQTRSVVLKCWIHFPKLRAFIFQTTEDYLTVHLRRTYTYIVWNSRWISTATANIYRNFAICKWRQYEWSFLSRLYFQVWFQRGLYFVNVTSCSDVWFKPLISFSFRQGRVYYFLWIVLDFESSLIKLYVDAVATLA
jgi:hypothetical protein